MRKLFPFFKKFALVSTLCVFGLAANPASGALAAGLQVQSAPLASQQVGDLRLELIWARAQLVYQREGKLLSLADGFVARAQALIDRATNNGWDTSAVQVALDAFESVIPAAQAAHLPGAAIIAAHDGFSMGGKVTDRTAAIDTIKSLAQVLKDTRTAMNGTGRALRQAVQAFRAAHRSVQAPVTP